MNAMNQFDTAELISLRQITVDVGISDNVWQVSNKNTIL